MFNLISRAAEITAFTAKRYGININDTDGIIKHYKDDTFASLLGEFNTVEDARAAAKKFPTKRETFQSNGATWLRVEWMEIAKTTEDDTEAIVEYIYPAEVGKPADGYASKGNLEDYVDSWEVAQMLHEVTYLSSIRRYDDDIAEDEFQVQSFNDLPEFLDFARRSARDVRDDADFAEINTDACYVYIDGDYITVTFSADGENPREVEISVACALEFSKNHAEFDYKFDSVEVL